MYRHCKPHFGASSILSLSPAFILRFLVFRRVTFPQSTALDSLLLPILLQYENIAIQRLTQDEALERSGDDINKKLTGFDALTTKDKMKQFLVELNATIPRFKDQVRLTGSNPELKSRCREYLERV